MNNKERYNQIIDAAYENYSKEYEKDNSIGLCLLVKSLDGKSTYIKPDKEGFVTMCEFDEMFSNTWGLKIEQRELSENEINDLKLKLILDYLIKKNIITVSFEALKNDEDNIPNIDWRREAWDMIGWFDYGREGDRNKLKEVYADIKNIPTKLITLTYNNERIESYE